MLSENFSYLALCVSAAENYGGIDRADVAAQIFSAQLVILASNASKRLWPPLAYQKRCPGIH